MSRHAIVVMGAAGAGKSRIGAAIAAALEVQFVEGDAFHPPENVALMAAGIPLTDETRHGWLLALADQLRRARSDGRGVVIACSALKRRYRDLLRSGDDGVRFVFLASDAPLLRERLQRREGHYMPASLVDSQLEALEPPSPDERAWQYDAGASPESIVAHVVGRLLHDRART
ncbi:MAG TPA: gluconokinase [Gemmatimonadaceae bacterium]|nr:gluconokinase [Gemmatimonadaceae bacterium]